MDNSNVEKLSKKIAELEMNQRNPMETVGMVLAGALVGVVVVAIWLDRQIYRR
nr:hypothetical protein K-LCC10_0337 [Kaumoebavirus]